MILKSYGMDIIYYHSVIKLLVYLYLSGIIKGLQGLFQIPTVAWKLSIH